MLKREQHRACGRMDDAHGTSARMRGTPPKTSEPHHDKPAAADSEEHTSSCYIQVNRKIQLSSSSAETGGQNIAAPQNISYAA